MPDSKISALTELAAAPAAGDLFVIVDVSDTSMAASGTDKKLAASYLLNAEGTTTGATSQAQTFTSGIISNGQVGINRTPTTTLDVYHASSHSLLTIATDSTTANITAGFTVSADAVTTSLRAYTAASGGGSRLNFTVSGGYLLLGTLSADPVNIYAGNAARVVVGATGLTSLGHSATGTAYADVAASTTSAASLRLRSGSAPTTANDGDLWNDGALSYYGANSTTNAIVNHLRLRRNSTGTAAAGFGLGIIAELESSTTNAQSAGRLTWEWSTATHASRAAKGKLTAYYTSTEREAIVWTATSAGAQIIINGTLGEDWINVTFNTGWGNFGSGHQTCQYKKVGDMIYLRGSAARSSGSSFVIFTLPASYLPPGLVLIPTASNNAYGQITIATTGNVSLDAGSTTQVTINASFSIV